MAAKKESNAEHLDAVFETYGGKKRFSVRHPSHKKEIIVAAPNKDAAIVAAAKALGKKWTKYEFYAFCEVYAI